MYCFVDTIGPTDVGLKGENQEDDRGHGLFGNVFSRVDRWAQPITYIDVHDGDYFTVSCTSPALTLKHCYLLVCYSMW